MIQIIIKRNTGARLFDRMPLPKANKTRNIAISRTGVIEIKRSAGLSQYQTHPFVRKVSRIA